jgi:hypothetical protein
VPCMQPVQQAPAKQRPFVQVVVRSGALAPSTQTAAEFAPPGHASTPMRHGAPPLPMQLPPPTHATQAPFEQPLTQAVSVKLPYVHEPLLHVPVAEYVRKVVVPLRHAGAGGELQLTPAHGSALHTPLVHPKVQVVSVGM